MPESPAPRVIHHVHSSPGRTRLRLAWLRRHPEEAESLADALALLHESLEVQVRPWTGSVLCTYDPDELDEHRILRTVRRETRVAIVVRPGEESPEADAEYQRALYRDTPHDGSIRRQMGEAVEGLNREILRATDGRLDIGALTGLSFIAVGAAEIATSRTVPAPPWFNLAWWAFRTFTISGHDERQREGMPGTPGVRFAEAAPDGPGGDAGPGPGTEV